MDVQIKPGIQALVVPTQKFKTVRIDIHFLSQSTVPELAQRTLLANLLETSSQKYFNQIQLTQALSKMFGANFGVSAGRKGDLHDIGFSITVINDQFAQGKQLISEAISFLNEVICHPLLEQHRFDETTFERQKQNLINYVNSASEDKQFWASQQLRSITFGREVVQGFPSYGRLVDLKKLTNESIYQAYRKMIETDLVHISVSGNVDEESIKQVLSTLELPARQQSTPQLITRFKELPEPLQKKEFQDVSQARLNLSFNIPAYMTSSNYAAALIFNALFGASPQSKLFMNVREKASLAYYASSGLDLYNGILNIQTGIDPRNYASAQKIIQEQLMEMQKGQFTTEEFDSTKKGLKSDYQAGLDLQRAIHRRGLNDYLLNRRQSPEQWIDNISKVRKDEVVDLASQVKLRAEYFLSKEPS